VGNKLELTIPGITSIWHEDGRAISCGFAANWSVSNAVLMTLAGVLSARHLCLALACKIKNKGNNRKND
jgi:hypothetical protein